MAETFDIDAYLTSQLSKEEDEREDEENLSGETEEFDLDAYICMQILYA